MAFLHGKSAAVFFNATDLSAYLNNAAVNQSMAPAETTAFGASSKAYIVGLKDGTISLSGMFDGASGAVDPIIQAALGVDNGVFTFLSGGSTKGNRALLAQVDPTSYNVTAPVGDVVNVSIDLQADGGVDAGVSLMTLGAITATGNQTAEDNGSATTNGGVAHLHVTANTMNNTTTFKVQHSSDNSTFADLGTFTAVSSTSTTSQRLTIASGTTVNRYVRVQYTAAGTGSITFHVSFARR